MLITTKFQDDEPIIDRERVIIGEFHMITAFYRLSYLTVCLLKSFMVGGFVFQPSVLHQSFSLKV